MYVVPSFEGKFGCVSNQICSAPTVFGPYLMGAVRRYNKFESELQKKHDDSHNNKIQGIVISHNNVDGRGLNILGLK